MCASAVTGLAASTAWSRGKFVNSSCTRKYDSSSRAGPSSPGNRPCQPCQQASSPVCQGIPIDCLPSNAACLQQRSIDAEKKRRGDFHAKLIYIDAEDTPQRGKTSGVAKMFGGQVVGRRRSPLLTDMAGYSAELHSREAESSPVVREAEVADAYLPPAAAGFAAAAAAAAAAAEGGTKVQLAPPFVSMLDAAALRPQVPVGDTIPLPGHALVFAGSMTASRQTKPSPRQSQGSTTCSTEAYREPTEDSDSPGCTGELWEAIHREGTSRGSTSLTPRIEPLVLKPRAYSVNAGADVDAGADLREPDAITADDSTGAVDEDRLFDEVHLDDSGTKASNCPSRPTDIGFSAWSPEWSKTVQEERRHTLPAGSVPSALRLLVCGAIANRRPFQTLTSDPSEAAGSGNPAGRALLPPVHGQLLEGPLEKLCSNPVRLELQLLSSAFAYLCRCNLPRAAEVLGTLDSSDAEVEAILLRYTCLKSRSALREELARWSRELPATNSLITPGSAEAGPDDAGCKLKFEAFTAFVSTHAVCEKALRETFTAMQPLADTEAAESPKNARLPLQLVQLALEDLLSPLLEEGLLPCTAPHPTSSQVPGWNASHSSLAAASARRSRFICARAAALAVAEFKTSQLRAAINGDADSSHKSPLDISNVAFSEFRYLHGRAASLARQLCMFLVGDAERWSKGSTDARQGSQMQAAQERLVVRVAAGASGAKADTRHTSLQQCLPNVQRLARKGGA
eukprot:TRINITY_DN4120_c0_g1_i1.p1 TRINITY_DN4120_c0_g1~~TRINITY_DN4120_c0_g1_i1.p1  ORF type:complete len:739 (-),score=132.75 TRINITY_DN4120_c0_g1_i1:110-2326(-)